MEIREGRFRFTLRDVLVLFVVVALLLGVLTPLIQQSRERARAEQCTNNMRLLGLAFHNYADNFKHFPPSSGVTRNADGSIRAIDGWSFLVYLLPYECYIAFYETLDVQNGKPLVEPPGGGAWSATPHADAANQRRSELICPSNRNPAYVAGAGRVTNYKAMGATHIESLLVASPTAGVPLYLPDEETVHPDGACFPGTELKLSGFGMDGTGQTILAVETMDPAYGIWTVGAECTLVGVPGEQPNGDGDLELLTLEQYQNSYFAPVGFNGKYGDEAPAEVQRLKTYLAYDFQRADPGPYAGADPRNTYGPSSAHPGVVHHLFADGSVRTITKKVDFPYYMFSITRNGGDPTGWYGRAP